MSHRERESDLIRTRSSQLRQEQRLMENFSGSSIRLARMFAILVVLLCAPLSALGANGSLRPTVINPDSGIDVHGGHDGASCVLHCAAVAQNQCVACDLSPADRTAVPGRAFDDHQPLALVHSVLVRSEAAAAPHVKAAQALSPPASLPRFILFGNFRS
jgi:hypothetical protein